MLELGPNKSNNMRGNRRKTAYKKTPVHPPRSNKMPVDQDWPSVWPVARVFHPASVPLPLHQGWVEPGTTPPGKFANAELMKIPNFLHLTPPAIQRQCEALKSEIWIHKYGYWTNFKQSVLYLQNSAQSGPRNWILMRRLIIIFLYKSQPVIISIPPPQSGMPVQGLWHYKYIFKRCFVSSFLSFKSIQFPTL